MAHSSNLLVRIELVSAKPISEWSVKTAFMFMNFEWNIDSKAKDENA